MKLLRDYMLISKKHKSSNRNVTGAVIGKRIQGAFTEAAAFFVSIWWSWGSHFPSPIPGNGEQPGCPIEHHRASRKQWDNPVHHRDKDGTPPCVVSPGDEKYSDKGSQGHEDKVQVSGLLGAKPETQGQEQRRRNQAAYQGYAQQRDQGHSLKADQAARRHHGRRQNGTQQANQIFGRYILGLRDGKDLAVYIPVLPFIIGQQCGGQHSQHDAQHQQKKEIGWLYDKQSDEHH